MATTFIEIFQKGLNQRASFSAQWLECATPWVALLMKVSCAIAELLQAISTSKSAQKHRPVNWEVVVEHVGIWAHRDADPLPKRAGWLRSLQVQPCGPAQRKTVHQNSNLRLIKIQTLTGESKLKIIVVSAQRFTQSAYKNYFLQRVRGEAESCELDTHTPRSLRAIERKKNIEKQSYQVKCCIITLRICLSSLYLWSFTCKG